MQSIREEPSLLEVATKPILLYLKLCISISYTFVFICQGVFNNTNITRNIKAHIPHFVFSVIPKFITKPTEQIPNIKLTAKFISILVLYHIQL